MASFALRHKSQSLILKPHQTLFTSSRFYSSSNDNDGNSPAKPSNFSSYFTDNKPKFNQQQSSSTVGASSLAEIRKNLSEFRRRTSETPVNLNPKMPNSFQNFNNKNAVNTNPSFSKGGNLSMEKIRESLRKLRDNKVITSKNANERFSLNNYKESFRMKPSIGRDNNTNDENINMSGLIGGSLDSLPIATFGKEIKEKEAKKSGDDDKSKYVLVRIYSHAELGEKLKELRPDTSTLSKKKVKEGEEGWFSLSELQQRLGKLKEIEDKQSAERMGGLAFGELRKSIEAIQLSKDENPKVQKFDILSQPSFMSSPPKEHLVEKYFHPDNMSAAEKLKLELKKVRDEFKMSESDCGSTRVQIAQLTTEIHHLSSVLHKKDKHSRRGLQAKVQQRKKLLKYLRRTDWDSYCLVLSKLGLRDNPDYKN